MINIQGLNKAEVLAALYNASRPQGLGFLHFNPTAMTKEEAEKILNNHSPYFDYLAGRVMKISLASNELDERLYDRDNGPGAALRALEELLTRPTK